MIHGELRKRSADARLAGLHADTGSFYYNSRELFAIVSFFAFHNALFAADRRFTNFFLFLSFDDDAAGFFGRCLRAARRAAVELAFG